MEVVMVLFILFAAITFSTTQKSVEGVSLEQTDDAAELALPKTPENAVSHCAHYDGQIIERDLTEHTGEEDSADEG
jgi:hypothetical protein